MKQQINWGIIGLGKIAHQFAQDINRTDNANLVAVGSRSIDKAKSFAALYHAGSYCDSYKKVAQDSNVDIIYIATPHSFHFEHTLLCLQHDKAVLCEKPMGLDSDEVIQMTQLAQSKGLFLMEGLWTRFMPATQLVLDQINQGTVGSLQYIKADFGFKVNAGPESRLLDKFKGGGALLDIGIYPLFLCRLLLGDPIQLQASAIMADNGIDLMTAIVASYTENTKAILECSFISQTPTEAYIYGTKGFVKMHRKFHQAHQIAIHTYNDATTKVYEVPYNGNGYIHEIEHVHKCLQEGQQQSHLLSHELSIKLSQDMDRVKELIGLSYKA